jgi:hypothetical protein
VWRDGDEPRERTPEGFARDFMAWMIDGCGVTAGRYASVPDIEREFLPRFRVAVGCPYLSLGTLLRGLRNVTTKRERSYFDVKGKRCSLMEYQIKPRRRRS